MKKTILILLLLASLAWARDLSFTTAQVNDFIDACNGTGFWDGDPYDRLGASEDDTVTLSTAGNYALGGTAVSPLPAAGNITITGQGAATVLQGVFDCDTNTTTYTLTITDMTVEPQGGDGGNKFYDGLYVFSGVVFDGDTGGMDDAKLVEFDANTNAFTATMTDCTAWGGVDDNISCKSTTGGATASASSLTLYNCESYDCGAGDVDQTLTTHNNVTIRDYNGYYHTPGNGGALIASGARPAPIYLYGTLVSGGNVFVEGATNVNMSGGRFSVYELAVNCTITALASLGTSQGALDVLGDNAFVAGCYIDCSADTDPNGIFFKVASATIEGNVIVGLSGVGYGIRMNNIDTTGTHRINNNYMSGAIRNIYVRDVASTVYVYNNIGTGATVNLFITNDPSNVTVTGGYNVFPDGVDDDIVDWFAATYLTATDTTAEGELHADYWPIEGGNCDIGSGNIEARSLGDPDRYGRPKLSAYRDVIGPVYPQRHDVRNNLIPLVRQGRDLIAANYTR